jgi:hypothetical protein
MRGDEVVLESEDEEFLTSAARFRPILCAARRCSEYASDVIRPVRWCFCL